jgi:rhodanese-related sulfurtransferase
MSKSKPCGTCTVSTPLHFQQAYQNASEAMDTVVQSALPPLREVPGRKAYQARRINAKGMQSFVVKGLTPQRPVFYFGAEPRKVGLPLQHKDEAYGSLTNSGMTHTNTEGTLRVSLECPQIYIFDNGIVYPRHFHFVYGDDTTGEWEDMVQTVPVLCIVEPSFLDSLPRGARVVDARPLEYFQQEHLEGAVSLPADAQYTPQQVKKILSIQKEQTPIVVYCGNPRCLMARNLAEQLNALGFHNLFYLQAGYDAFL